MHCLTIDFTKAFDTVDHIVLISKLVGYNVSPPVVNSIPSFLCGRSQVCKVNGQLSVTCTINQGIVQEIMYQLCLEVWETGEWSNDWTKSVFIPLPKKADLSVCSNYRTISLVSHASKLLAVIMRRTQNKVNQDVKLMVSYLSLVLLTKVLSKRLCINSVWRYGKLENKVNQEIPDVQAGFRAGRGTRDQIVNLRLITEKAREFNQPHFLCFIDYRKAFDMVSHNQFWISMIDMGFPPHIIDLIWKLYRKQQSAVRSTAGTTEWFKIARGVRQG